MDTTTSYHENFLNTTGPLNVPPFNTTETILIVLIAGLLALLTIGGNVLVMLSFKVDKQLRTITNYFLLSLAVADLIIGLISMPLFTLFILYGYWPLGPIICDSWLAVDYLMSNASVLNLLIISFDRYLSITRPLTYRTRRTTRRALCMIAAAWLISLVLWPPWIFAWPAIEGTV
jgi:muscarinic acetylcholine receptor M3